MPARESFMDERQHRIFEALVDRRPDLGRMSRFSAGGGHGEKKQRVLNRLGEFFERFFGLGSREGA